MSIISNLKNLFEEVKKNIKEGKIDLSSDEDLSIGVMNLIAAEEHLFFTGAKTNNPEYFELLKTVREMRTNLMKTLLKNPEGEVWCTSKHLLAATMRLTEVATKKMSDGDKKTAESLFEQAYSLYSIYWLLKAKSQKPTETPKKEAVFTPTDKNDETKIRSAIKEFVTKLEDCCDEKQNKE